MTRIIGTVILDAGERLATFSQEELKALQIEIRLGLDTAPEFPECVCRDGLPGLLKLMGARVGAEIGVQRAEFSTHLLRNWPGKLYLIDPWRHQQRDNYHDVANVSDEEHLANYQAALDNLRPFPDRYNIIRDFSPGAARHFKDGGLDFVYLDGNHSEEAVLADLEAWLPKVRAGGLVSGHDFMDSTGRLGDIRVRAAVTEFVRRWGYELYVSREAWPSLWYFQK